MKKVILITGGTDGLGKETAKILAKSHKVVIASLNQKKVDKVSKELKVDGYKCDISKPEEIKETIKEIVKKHKKIDVLINNAGLWIEGNIEKHNPEEIMKVNNVNLGGAMMLTALVVKEMKKKKSGFIININSQAGLYAKAYRSVYAATKWGLKGFTKALQEELPKLGIKVSGVYPGGMKTRMFDKYGIKKGTTHMMDPKVVAESIKYMIDMGGDIVLPELGIKHYKR